MHCKLEDEWEEVAEKFPEFLWHLKFTLLTSNEANKQIRYYDLTALMLLTCFCLPDWHFYVRKKGEFQRFLFDQKIFDNIFSKNLFGSINFYWKVI